MQSVEIRKKYLEFFKSKGHAIRPSSPLVPPPDDPTLLFTTAGMVQFKPLWAGAELPFKRAATVQKCLRAGGKGSDLENVGKTLRHHTFFEMLGNFSFGDYFKREAIQFAAEFVFDVLKMPKDKIWVSVYKNDDEALAIWRDEIGIKSDRMVRLGEKDNFWGPAGVSGACGPCSEIYYDLGPDYGCGSADCKPGCDCERYLEFWNLVFPQFYQNEDGSRKPLERKGIDTGMGLERLSFLLQDGAKNNYETDLFKPIVNECKKYAKVPYDGENKSSYHVVSDHIRALTFVFSEGVMPSNEGRGYVLRRLLRRAVRHGRKLGITEPFLYKLVDVVINIMKESYPELLETREQVTRIVLSEEERFQRTIDYGLSMLEEITEKLKKNNTATISGEDIFKLYDTYGFPVDLLQEIALEKSLNLDLSGFEKFMAGQKEKARQSWTGAEKANINPIYSEIKKDCGEQKFLGYEKIKLNAKVIAIVSEGKKINGLGKGKTGEVFLDQTPFYAEQGGQAGDTGKLVSAKGEIEVSDTKRIMQGVIVHKVLVENGEVNIGDEIEAVVDEDRRLSIMRHHTATHLLQYVLRQVLGDHVKQAGSLVAPHKLRFDFTHFAAITKEELSRIEQLVNIKVLEDVAADCYELPREEALKKGVLAFFGEKYGEVVRVLDIGGYSKELCGGTHVDKTGKIGYFRILSESSVAAGVRRIEACAGFESIKIANEEKEKLAIISEILKSEPESVLNKVRNLVNEHNSLSKEKEKLHADNVVSLSTQIIEKVQEINGIKVISENVGVISVENIRRLGDLLKEKIKSGIIVLGSNLDGKVSLLAVVTDDLVQKGYHAGKIIKEVSVVVGGSGGGKPNMAQAGGKNPELLDNALKKVREIV